MARKTGGNSPKKRDRNQIEADRARLAQLLYTGMTYSEIATQLSRETGISLTVSQIAYDVKKLREEWRSTRLGTYEAMVEQELQRLDVLEGMLWQALRDSTKPEKIKVIDKRMKKIGDDPNSDEAKAIIRGIKETIKTLKADPKVFHQILEVQKERRRLLGLYAPSVSLHQQTISVKSYQVISPDDWDKTELGPKDVVDGAFEQSQPSVPLLPLGGDS